MTRILIIIVTLYVLFGAWVISELPQEKQCVPAEYVPIEAGKSTGDACRFPERLRQVRPCVPTTMNGELK